MKFLIQLIAFTLWLSVLSGCSGQDKTKVVSQYKYEENTDIITVKPPKKPEPWVKEGVTCYGIIMVCDLEGSPLRLKEVLVKVTSIQPDGIKMETLEDVYMNPLVECKKVSVKKGGHWNEETDEIFKTREEAIKYIDRNYPGLRANR